MCLNSSEKLTLMNLPLQVSLNSNPNKLWILAEYQVLIKLKNRNNNENKKFGQYLVDATYKRKKNKIKYFNSLVITLGPYPPS